MKWRCILLVVTVRVGPLRGMVLHGPTGNLLAECLLMNHGIWNLSVSVLK